MATRTPRRILLGAIADDLTGGTDLALTLAREGMRVTQTVGLPDGQDDFGDAEAVVVSLKTRNIRPADAVAQSRHAARHLLDAGASQLFFKYCSTFDSTDEGNIGPVAEALLEITGGGLTIACPAFPANGRTVYRGHLFVHDALLSESPLKDHPLNPMRDANLVRVLGRQTSLPVHLVGEDVVAEGPAAIADALASYGNGIAIVDAISETDLRAIGVAAARMPLVTGGSGVALGLPGNLIPAARRRKRRSQSLAVPAGRQVILAGSTSEATRQQVAKALDAGITAIRIDPIAVHEGRQTVDAAAQVLAASPDTSMAYSSDTPDAVKLVQDRIGRNRAGELVERFMAELAVKLRDSGFNRFIVAGGETSGAVVAALGARVLSIGPEIDPGVPWTRSVGSGPPLALALKSGNFGTPDFFLKAWTLLA